MSNLKISSEILIVEDSFTQAKKLERILKIEGYSVTVARDGVQGLSMVRDKKVDVIISDVIMPEMNGYDMCRKIKDDPSLRDIPVILLTSLSDPRDVIEGLKCGADNFLTKPYETIHLLTRIHHVLVNREMRRSGQAQMSVEVYFAGQYNKLTADRIQIVDLLLSTFEAAVLKNSQLEKLTEDYKNALDETKRAHENLHNLIDTIGDAVVVIGKDGIVRYINPAGKDLLGCDCSPVTGVLFPFPVDKEGSSEITIRHRSDREMIGDMKVINSNWDGEAVKLAVIRDVSETVRLREQLKVETITDSLTGLYNRRGFISLGKDFLKKAKKKKTKALCLYGDLDCFKEINDTLGHKEGDNVLRDIAGAFKETFRSSDIIGRLGGDEFAVLLIPSLNVDADIETLGERLDEKIIEINDASKRPHKISISLGYSLWDPENPLSLTDLVTRADKEMYEAKRCKIQ